MKLSWFFYFCDFHPKKTSLLKGISALDKHWNEYFWRNWKFLLTLQGDPAMRGFPMPESRAFGQGLTYERRLLALSLGSEKLPHSLDIVKDEAIVDAPWVRICMAASILRDWADISTYPCFAGSFTIAHSTISGCGRPLGAGWASKWLPSFF